MTIIVKKLEIEKLFGLKNINWDLKDVNVLVGKNGAGKSTILGTIFGLLKQETNDSITQSKSCTITLSNNGTISNVIDSLNVDTPQVLNLIELLEKQLKKIKPKNSKSYLEMEKLLNALQSRAESDQVKPIRFGSLSASDNLKDKEMVNVELISTVNMSANSVYEFKTSDGEKTTILDMEITNELSRFKDLFIHHNKHFILAQENLTNVINDLFHECNKTVHFDKGSLTIESNSNGESIAFNKLSSGERQLLYILLKSANTSEDDTVLLMDEPEISLHLSWQEKLITSIKKINTKCQLIIVTHSPAIIMKGWLDSYIDIKNIQKDVL